MEQLFCLSIDRIKPPIEWHRVLKDSGVLRGLLNKIILSTCSQLSTETCIAASLVCKSILALASRGGMLTTAVYLKHCRVALQMSYGADIFTPLPFPISLTRTGYPRIIPSFHRHLIRRRDSRSDVLVRLYMSVFSIGRIVKLAKVVSKSTYQSIVTPPDDMDRIRKTISSIKDKFKEIFPRYLPNIHQIPLEQGVTWDTISKAYPNSNYLKHCYQHVLDYYDNCVSLKGRLSELIQRRVKLRMGQIVYHYFFCLRCSATVLIANLHHPVLTPPLLCMPFSPCPKTLRSRKSKQKNFKYHLRDKCQLISFIAGQPLGLMSSWTLFALSHHIIVWCAAE
ncbi:hypothetical protein ZOSMA_54G00050 [Zostera marina]|uniref:Uncharacterized protein n=1 Tax=Zostera marina TaxID=29655 RepID=A0A0K9NWD1_ZOSMR|nr:hypothetical protein ZOSMA_54G00050 [Zostera marina]